MKGIYLTEEGKKAIEDLIAKLTDYKDKTHDIYAVGQIYILKQILSSATILPVEESWDGVFDKTFSQAYIEKDYPDGVIIIKSKQ
jgi:hypothetical protein